MKPRGGNKDTLSLRRRGRGRDERRKQAGTSAECDHDVGRTTDPPIQSFSADVACFRALAARSLDNTNKMHPASSHRDSHGITTIDNISFNNAYGYTCNTENCLIFIIPLRDREANGRNKSRSRNYSVAKLKERITLYDLQPSMVQ